MQRLGREGEIALRLGRDVCYRRMFADAFPGEGGDQSITKVASAISSFERTLVSRDAPYDRYERGDQAAISENARRGEALFFDQRLNCASCHLGPLFTDAATTGAPPVESFHNIGGSADGGPSRDMGLSEITADRKDDGRFRTPSLRNVSLTAPYLHDGSAVTLRAAINAHNRLARAVDQRISSASISSAQMTDLIAFLDALTDKGFVSNPKLSLPKRFCGNPA